jgi:hypothetical protein
MHETKLDVKFATWINLLSPISLKMLTVFCDRPRGKMPLNKKVQHVADIL